jgi:hypothetical protein
MVGVNICEDVWLPDGPTGFHAAAGAEGIKITHRALGKDRRMPITNWYRNS